MNGARWQLRAFTQLKEETTIDQALGCLTASIIKNQQTGKPVHTWKMPKLIDYPSDQSHSALVEEFMATDLFTVQKDDIIQLVAEMMDWRNIRYTPVEDKNGKLIGLVTSRVLLHHLIKKSDLKKGKALVKDIMIEKPITIGPEATILEARHLMRSSAIGCLPVVKDGELLGLITAMDF